jgi:uncharacterized protein (TIGR01777 family)
VRVGVTGSSGFIGAALVAALRERGDDVVRFVRPDTTPTGDQVIRWDPSNDIVDEEDLRRVGHFDAVVNLAGAGIADKRWSPSRKVEISDSRLSSTMLLVHAMHVPGSGSDYVASGSAIGIYGSRGDEQLDETSTVGTDFLANICAQWEDVARPLETGGTTVSYLRTGIVMSASGGALKKQLPLFRYGVGGKLSRGTQWISPISLVDEVRAILWAIDHRLAGPLNLVAPASVTNADFTKVLGAQLRRPALLSVPRFALELVLGRELVREAVLASQHVAPAALLASGFGFSHPDIGAILKCSLSVHT